MAAKRIYQLKITLKGSRPPIWRRLQLRGDITLAALHRSIQALMGWEDCHLHEFRIAGNFFGMPLPDNEDVLTNEKAVALQRVVKSKGARFLYVYDFADNWRHGIVVERIFDAEEGVAYPVCTAGRRACPPENSGSIENYYLELEVMKHPEHPAYSEMIARFGKKWDPEAFDLEQTNLRLKAFMS
jgi:hypothetical protein